MPITKTESYVASGGDTGFTINDLRDIKLGRRTVQTGGAKVGDPVTTTIQRFAVGTFETADGGTLEAEVPLTAAELTTILTAAGLAAKVVTAVNAKAKLGG